MNILASQRRGLEANDPSASAKIDGLTQKTPCALRLRHNQKPGCSSASERRGLGRCTQEESLRGRALEVEQEVQSANPPYSIIQASPRHGPLVPSLSASEMVTHDDLSAIGGSFQSC
ncbi:hypothetical protein KM043_007868 [Ampulex compressa]|nr:hypothetical protein KM043_007868 [Ampulex compressa]